MKRLIETQSVPGSSTAYLAELVRAVEPSRPDPFKKQQLRRALSRKPARGRKLLQPVLVAMALLSLAAGAGAALGGWWPPSQGRRLEPVMSERLREVAKGRLSKAPQGAVPPAPSSVEAVAPPAPATDEPLATKGLDEMAARLSAPRSGPVPAEGTKSRRDDPALVGEAIRALRTDRDPTRAGQLLSRYLAVHPRGVLVEDALALSIEAAVARRDPRASEYAYRYLNRFPEGRFVKVARRALTTTN